ncbi:MAG: DNA double-strand break repair nuclease NurA [Promethearchaeia archaeon]
MSEDDKEFEETLTLVSPEGKIKSPIKNCINFIESAKKEFKIGDKPFVSGTDEESFPIAEKRIKRIPTCKDIRKVGFVDGGNAPLIKSADFNVSLNRVAGTIFRSSEFIPLQDMPEVVEFYSATILSPTKGGGMEFHTKFFPQNPEDKIYLPKKDIKISISDESIRERGFLPRIERFGGIARRFAEWSYAKELIKRELDEKDIFVRDGSLQTGYKDEILLAERLYKKAKHKNVYVTGISKTCRLFTTRGDSLISAVDYIASNKYPKERWYFHPIYKITKADNQADLYFVKLHAQSDYPFRFDIYLEQSEKLDQQGRENIISNIATTAQDLSFPGYPYGLIKVDQLSRVAFRELDSYKVMLLSEFPQDIYENFIVPRVHSVNAHDLINKVRINR